MARTKAQTKLEKKLEKELRKERALKAGEDSKCCVVDTDQKRCHCQICGVWVNVLNLEDHIAGKRHKRSQALHEAQKAKTILAADKGGVVVTPAAIPIPTVDATPGQTVSVTFNVHVLATATQGVLLRSCRLLDKLPNSELSDEYGMCLGATPTGLQFPPGCSYDFVLKISQQFIGVVMPTLVLKFKKFEILRQVKIKFDNAASVDISATAPYERPQIKKPMKMRDIVLGEPPLGSDAKLANPPGKHIVPSAIRADMASEAKPVISDILKQSLTPKTYSAKMCTLLFVEELALEVNIRQYDMQGVTMSKSSHPGKLLLQVPGLAENRPSVLKGDSLYVTHVNAGDSGKEYQGCVHSVLQEEVLLGFHRTFHNSYISNMKVNVRFGLNRGPLNFIHRALQLLDRRLVPQGLLFPSAAALPPAPAATALPALHWVDKNLNAEQQLAVRMIVWGGHGAMPYIVFGPPGTGKTKTMVEAMMQVLKVHSSSRILAVAPSNSAADLLAMRLLANGLAPSQLMRVNAYSRTWVDLPQTLQQVSRYDEGSGHFYIPSKEQLASSQLRVVVATCIMAAKLYASGVPSGHFSHVFMDEAGHAEEPLALAALAGLADPAGATRVVLAGDPKQLGPIVHSPMAKQGGLEMSLLERLEGAAPHCRDPQTGAYDHRCITKLVRNYRSHPEILRLPSQLFYHGDLQACADTAITHSLLGWDELPNPQVPFIFHGVKGEDEREANSPSWFNVMEAKLVVEYAKKVVGYRRLRLPAEEIGVITPYRKQVQKLRKLMDANGLAKVRVGSVEEFQGQERRVILISTVRSNPDQMDFDRRHHLGFVANAKRFNVAVTRAKALLIVVGNPELLARDPNWRALLKLCVEQRAYRGHPPPADLDAPAPGATVDVDPREQLQQLLAGLSLGPDEEEEEEGEQIVLAEGPEWRRVE